MSSSDLLARVSSFLGYGDVDSARVWFIGLEEALALKEIEKLPETSFQPYDGCAGSPTPVYVIMSKIVLGLQGANWKTEWPVYRNERLFSTGSEAVQANLYPLGKPNMVAWPYADQLGLSAEAYYHGCEQDSWGRFALLRRLRLEKKPPLTICFGKGWWDTFASALELESEAYESNEPFRLYPEARVLMTPFFSARGRGGMSNAKIETLLALINDCRLNPFDT